ncbi:MAG: hypothetical protein IT291_10625 [Deltaproteobacteria bacterium]|nr:hypothetical protein [Deltaproteobacteria bacterium]
MRFKIISLGISLLLLLSACNGAGIGTTAKTSGNSSTGSNLNSGNGDSIGLGDTPSPIPGGGGLSGGGGDDGGSDSGGGSGTGGGGSGGGSTVRVNVNPGTSGGVTRTKVEFSGRSAEDGLATVELSLSNTTSFQVVTQKSGVMLGTLELLNPSSASLQSLFENEPPFSDGLNLFDNLNALPYPSRLADEQLIDGVYTQVLVFLDNGEAIATNFDATVVAKSDANLTSGVLRTNIFLLGSEAQKDSTVAILNNAIDVWRDVYASRGVELDIEMFDVSSDSGIVPSPSVGSSLIADAINSNGAQIDALNIFVGEDISEDDSTSVVAGGDGTLGVLGVAAGRPGSAIVASTSYVAISLLMHQGGDGSFSNEEVVVLGETLAHEGGHYLGLMHPVEIVSEDFEFVEGDRLTDTATCDSIATCRGSGLVSNNMFPTPVTGVGSQQDLSAQQGGVINLQAIVD